MEAHLTVCPRNCYSTCSFIVWTEGNRIRRIEPDPSNKSVPEGPCLKGLSYIERTHSPERILFPLKKNGQNFTKISWEHALDEISGKLNHYRKTFGPHSILYYASSGMSGLLNNVGKKFWKEFGGTTTVYGNLCWPAGLEASRLTLGENKHSVPWDLENASLILFWGKNPAECNIQQMIPVEKAQQKGARLVVIDPRHTSSSARADLLLQPKPGTDGILALALAKLIIDNDDHDTDFINSHVGGFEEFSTSLNSLKPASAAKECGIPLKLIKTLAKWLGQTKPMTLIAGYGMQRFSNGGQTTRCLLSLPIITGNIGKTGAGWQYANLQSYVFDSVKEPDSYYPSASGDQPFRRIIPTARLGEVMHDISEPHLKMAWVERGNPIAQNPDSNSTLKAFRSLEYRVVIEQFMTDTAREADIILPAKSMFEQTDICGSYWNPYVSLRQKVIDPPGEVKPETEIYHLLAQSLKFDKLFVTKNLPENNDEAIEKYLENELYPFPELSLEKLKKAPQMAPGLDEIAFQDMVFKTPSGKIELYSDQANEKWGVNSLPVYIPLEKASRHFPLYLMSPNTKNRIHSQFGNLNVIKANDPEPYATMSAHDAEERNLAEGDRIRIFNKKGEITHRVHIDHGIRPGCIVVFNGYWNYNEGGPNILSTGKETDMGHGTAFHDTRVEVIKSPA